MLQSTVSRAPRRAVRPLCASVELPRAASTAVEARDVLIPKLKLNGRRSGLVRLADVSQSPAHAFAALRAIEQRYGRVADFKFPHDHEITSCYQNRFVVRFLEDDSLKKTPPSGHTIHIESPVCNLEHPGGVSLEELAPYLLPTQENHNFKPLLMDALTENEKKIVRPISINLEHAGFEFIIFTQKRSPRRTVTATTSKNFLNWGGFYKLQLDSQPIDDMELFTETSIEHIRMRRALQKHAALLKIQNPYEPPSVKQKTTSAAGTPTEAMQADVPSPLPIQPKQHSSAGVKPLRTKVSASPQASQSNKRATKHERSVASQRSSLEKTEVAKVTEIETAEAATHRAKLDAIRAAEVEAAMKAAKIATDRAKLAERLLAAETEAANKATKIAADRAILESLEANKMAIEAEGARRAAKIAADRARLESQLKAADIALDRLGGKKDSKNVNYAQTTKVEYKPTFKITPQVEEKIEKKGITSRIAAFFRLGK